MISKADQAARYLEKKRRAREREKRLSTAGREISHEFPGGVRADRDPGDFEPFRRKFFSESPEQLARCFWSALSGRYPVIALVGGTKAAARIVLGNVRRYLANDKSLLEAFPEVCFPIRRMGGCGQSRPLWNGEPVGVALSPDLLVLPALPKCRTSGVRIIAAKRGHVDAESGPGWLVIDVAKTPIKLKQDELRRKRILLNPGVENDEREESSGNTNGGKTS